MSKILCVIDGMTDPDFCAGEYTYLSSMRLSHYEDTAGNGEPETLRCVLRLLGVKEPPIHLRGYVEALGAGIPIQPDDLIVRGSLYKLDSQGRCTIPCIAPDALDNPHFRYYPLGQYKALLVYPNMGHTISAITTRLPSSGAGQSAVEFCPKGSDILSDTFRSLMTDDTCMILWGQSTPVYLPPFPQSSAVICGKEIVKGIARLLRMDLIDLHGATGDVDTDLDSKTDAALSAAERYPFVLLHINGADEASHRRNPAQKKQFIHQVDIRMLSRLLQSKHEVVVVSDHGTDPQNGLHLGNDQPVFTNR